MAHKTLNALSPSWQVISFSGLLLLGMSQAWPACPVEGCPPFQTNPNSFPVTVQDTLEKFLGLPAKRSMQVALFPKDTGMTWEYHLEYEQAAYLGGQATYLMRMTLLDSKDSGTHWKSRWRIGYQGKSIFYSTTHIPFEHPWKTYDTTLVCHSDSGIDWSALLTFFPKTINPFSRSLIRPLASDSLAVSTCCQKPISNGQSSAPLHVFIDRKWGRPSEVHIYQQDRGILFSWFSVVAPGYSLRAAISLNQFGRELIPVPVQPLFQPRQRKGGRHLVSEASTFFSPNLLPVDILGRNRNLLR